MTVTNAVELFPRQMTIKRPSSPARDEGPPTVRSKTLEGIGSYVEERIEDVEQELAQRDGSQ